MAQEIKNDDTTAWALVVVRNTSGIGVTGLTASDFSSVNVQRDNLAASSLTLTDASGPTDHGAGKLWEIDAGVYKVGIASALLTGFVGNLSITGTYASGAVVPVPNNVVEPERGTDSANTTTPPTAAAIRTEMDSNSTQLAAIVEDTGTTLPSTLSGIETKVDTVDGVVDSILVDTGTTLPASLTSISSAITVVDGIVDDILVDTSTTLPATLSGMETKIDTVDTVVDTLTTSLTGVETKIDTIDGIVDSILVDTGTTLPATLSGIETKVDTIDGIVDDILVDTGTTLPATLTTIDTELGQVLDRTGYALTIYAGAISNAANAAELYTLTLDSTDYTVQYAGMDSSGNRGTTTLSKA